MQTNRLTTFYLFKLYYSMRKEKKVVGAIQISLGIILLLFDFKKPLLHPVDFIPLGMGLLVIINGILILTGKVNIQSREPWQYKLMIGLFLAAMVLAFLTKPKSTYISSKQKIETELQNR